MSSGKKLHLLPCFLGFENPDLLSAESIANIHSLRCFIAENAKSCRAFLKAVQHPLPQSEFDIFEIDKHHPENGLNDFLQTHADNEIGLISEAGMPCIADPGHLAVQFAIKQGFTIAPHAGLNSMLMALMASGFSGNTFKFNGYLPLEKAERVRKIKWFEQQPEPQIFMETPYRNQKLFEELLNILKPQTMLCIAANISHPQESIKTMRIDQWRVNVPDLHKIPVVFIIGRF